MHRLRLASPFVVQPPHASILDTPFLFAPAGCHATSLDHTSIAVRLPSHCPCLPSSRPSPSFSLPLITEPSTSEPSIAKPLSSCHHTIVIDPSIAAHYQAVHHGGIHCQAVHCQAVYCQAVHLAATYPTSPHKMRRDFLCVIPLLHPFFLPDLCHSYSSLPFARSRERMMCCPPNPGGNLCMHTNGRFHNEADNNDPRGWT